MRILRSVDKDFWWDVARRCDYATFFHTPLWSQLVVRTYPNYRDATIGAELENGTRVVLPLLEIGRSIRGLFRSVMSTFAGCYGGPIADGPLSTAEQVQIYEAAKTCRVAQLIITGNPLISEQIDLNGFTKREDFTYILDLCESFETIFSRFSKGHRSSTAKGRRLGITTRIACVLEDYRQYFRVYEDSLRRWGEKASSEYPLQLFENGYWLFQRYPDHLKLWLAELDGRIIAGAWVFYWNHHVVYWHGAAYKEYFTYSPVNVLLADIIKDACERGYKYFDFNPSGGHEGVAAFKRRFGARKQPIQHLQWISRSFRVVQRITRVMRKVDLQHARVPKILLDETTRIFSVFGK